MIRNYSGFLKKAFSTDSGNFMGKGNYSGLILLLVCTIGLLFANISIGTVEAEAQISLTISKTNNAPNPIASGQPFTYTITYSWSGGAPGTLYIIDNVPAALDVISALPNTPVSTISGNQVVFVLTGLTLPSGSGTVQINAKFKPGVTCGGTVACNRATISLKSDFKDGITSNENCVTAAQPTNKWQFEKEWIAGCALDDEVIFRIKMVNPSGSDIGGLNLTNVQLDDILPPGAILLQVYGNWSGISGTTLTGGPTTLGVSPWTIWYTAYIKVKFPSGPFTAGQQVTNTATLKFNTPCNSNFNTWQDTAKATLCNGVTTGQLNKWLSLGLYFPNNPSYYPVFTPGCCGTYTLWYNNTGTLGQNNFIMEDMIPGELDLNKITTNVPATNTPVTVDVYCWSGSSCGITPCTTVTYTTAGTYAITGLPPNVCRVKWTYGGTVSIGQTLYNYLDVCVRTTNYQNGAAVSPPQNIINTVTATATGMPTITVNHTKPVDVTQPKVISSKLFLGNCAPGCYATPAGPYQPGDVVRFRMAVANIGNANATTCTINDLLPSGLSYAGNETYFYGTFNWMTNIYNPPCCSTLTTVPANIGSSITSPAVGATNLTWTFPVLPARCDGQVDYFIIDFDVLISANPPAPAGQYANTFNFTASNVPTFTSNVAYLTVNQTAQLQALKEVMERGSSTPYSSSAIVTQGNIADFRLTVVNTGNSALSNLCLLDIMPWVGDIKVLPVYNPRNSAFDLPYNPANGPISITPTGFAATYNTTGLITSKNPTRSTECGGFCGVSDPPFASAGTYSSAPTNTYSFKVNANPSVNLAPGATLNVVVPALINQSTTAQLTACNSFGIQAIPIGMPSVCLSAESNTACVTVKEKIPCFEFEEFSVDCIGPGQNGTWIYSLSFVMNYLGSGTYPVGLSTNIGSISGLTPNTITGGTPTLFTATFTAPNASGGVCFTFVVYDKEGHKKLCDTTICKEYWECPPPCPCPFDLKVDRQVITQTAGNQVVLNSMFSSSANMLQVRASIVSASITQYCFNGGSQTYTPAATFTSGNPWGPINPLGIGTSELTWTNNNCPPLSPFALNANINLPTAPKKGCYQRIKICIRYTFTDCKCNTCDTLVCYEFTRKWIPIIIWHDWLKDIGVKEAEKETNEIFAEEADFATIQLSSSTEGKLTIINPADDEFTQGITINAISLRASPGVAVSKMTPSDISWSEGAVINDAMVSNGMLEPGKSLMFDIKYDNPLDLKKWINNIDFAFRIDGINDVLTGSIEVITRTPDDKGGDELINETPGNSLRNARTFALRFINANKYGDSIANVTLAISDGTLLAVGPGFDDSSYPMAGVRTTSGQFMLMQSPDDESIATISALPAGTIVGPIYITVANENPESITLNYTTNATDGTVITEGSIEMTNPVLGIGEANSESIDLIMASASPNPSNGTVNIDFTLKKDEIVTIYLSDMTGRIVENVINSEAMNSGKHQIAFDGKALTSGTYYFTIKTGKESITQKVVIAK